MGRDTTVHRVKKALLSRERRKGQHLTKADDQVVYQTAMALGSKMEAARRLGITERTVHRACARVEALKSPAQIAELKRQSSEAVASAAEEMTHRILESISPDDLKSGRIEVKNSKGEVVDYKYYGPSLLQKATSVGILTDKLKVLRDMERSVGNDLSSGALMMPESADQLIAAIKNRVESISVLQVNLRKDHPELATRLDAVMEVEAAEVTEAGTPADERFPFDQ